MPDITEVSKREETEIVNGILCKFKYLNSYDKATIIEESRCIRKQKIIDTARTAGVNPDDLALALTVYNDDPEGDFLRRKMIHLDGQMARLKFNDDQALPHRMKLESNPPNEFVDFVTDYGGSIFALGLSLEKTYPNEGQKIARSHDMDNLRAEEIMMKVCGLIRPKPPAAKGDEPNPTKPEATPENPNPTTNDTSSPASAA